MAEFLNMGGYAFYVWSVYGLAALVIPALVLLSVLDYRRQQRLATKLEAAAGGRVRRAARASVPEQTRMEDSL